MKRKSDLVVCLDCGKVFKSTYRSREYCPDCLDKRQAEKYAPELPEGVADICPVSGLEIMTGHCVRRRELALQRLQEGKKLSMEACATCEVAEKA